MAYEIATAANLEDLFGRIVAFLTTNAALVGAGQNWTVLRQHRAGLASVTTNLTEQGSAAARRVIHGFRYEPRSLNINNPQTNDGHVLCTGFVAGTSYVSMVLKSARAVDTVRLGAPKDSGTNQMIRNFRLQYSDDGSAWTTALTVAANPAWNIGETRDFAVPAAGAHLYWRILIDSNNIGSGTSVSWRNLLLLAGGVGPNQVANHFGSRAILMAPGNAGTEQIYVGLGAEYDAANGWYNLVLNGYTGFDALETSWFEQPGALPGYGAAKPLCVPMVPCWDAPMPYWVAANGRRFVLGVKVSTNFEGAYAGFLLPYATPAQYPYPLVIGGSLIPQNGNRGAEWRYSYSSYRHSVFPIPASDAVGADVDATLYLRRPDAAWGSIGQRYGASDPDRLQQMTMTQAYPPGTSGPIRGVWPTAVRDHGSGGRRRDYREVLGGGYILQPLIVLERSPMFAVWGELEGALAISGFGNAAENTTNWAGTEHVVLQNASRTAPHEYWALALA